MLSLTVPIPVDDIRALHVGDAVTLSGTLVAGRDAAHKFMVEHFIRQPVAPEDQALYKALRCWLEGGAIYHCGPVIKKNADGNYGFVAAGPTTSIHEEIYQPEVIAAFNLRAVIVKGGMGSGTLRARQKHAAAGLRRWKGSLCAF